jgi:uncharacterized protein YbjT (DUF2867 family)
MSHNLLVTGATGNIGQALIARLQHAGAAVIAGSTAGQPVAGAPGRVVDFTRPDTLAAAFEGVDTLFLLFPLRPDKLALARHAMQAARRAGVRHVVRSSGAGADTNSPYAISRLQGEIDQTILDAGIPATLLRPSNFMQNWVNYYAGMVKSGSVYLPNGEGRAPWIDVRDIAAAAAAVLLQPNAHAGRVYELSGPELLDTAEVLQRIEQASGTAATYVPVTEAQAAAQMSASGMSPWTVEIMSSLGRLMADGAAARRSTDLLALTGREGNTFDAFAREHADQWR